MSAQLGFDALLAQADASNKERHDKQAYTPDRFAAEIIASYMTTALKGKPYQIVPNRSSGR